MSRNNKLLFRAVQGRAPGADNYFDQGIVKMLYDIDVSPLIESAKDGQVAIEELHYGPNGKILPVPQTEQGPAANPSAACKR